MRQLLAIALACSGLLAQEVTQNRELTEIRKLLVCPGESERNLGLQRLVNLGEAGAAAVPDLSALLVRLANEERVLRARSERDPAAARARRRIEPQQSAVLRTLGALGPAATHVLLPWLANPTDRLRRQATASYALTRPCTADVLALAMPGDEMMRLVVLDVVRLLPHSELREAAPFVVAALDAPGPAARAAALTLLEARRHDRSTLELLRARMLGAEGPGKMAASLLCASVASRPITVEAFEAALRSPDAAMRALGCVLVARLGEQARRAMPSLLAAVDDADPSVRVEAMRALQVFGPGAAAVVPILQRRLGDDDASTPGLAVLVAAGLGAVGLPLLRDAMRDDSYVIRRQAVSVLPQLGKDALPALADVLRLARVDKPEVAAAAIVALGELPTLDDPRAAQRLVAAIRDGLSAGPLRRAAALQSLQSLGPRGAAAVPDLIALLERSTSNEASHPEAELAMRALAAIGVAGCAAVPIVARCADKQSPLATTALRALAAIAAGLDPEQVATARLIDRLEPLLQAGGKHAPDAALVLGRLGEAGLPAVNRLLAHEDAEQVALGGQALIGLARTKPDLVLELARSEEEATALLAITALGHATERRAVIAGELAEWLSAKPERRSAILAALAGLGPEAAIVAPALIEQLDGEPGSAAAVVAALGAMGEPVVALLVAKLGQDARRDVLLVEALGRAGAAARRAVPQVVALLQATSDETLRAACVATLPRLGELGLRAAAGLDVADELLIGAAGALLGSREPAMRRRGLALLRRRPALVEDHAQVVIHLSRDPDPALRELAVRCLGVAGGGASQQVMEALVDARHDHDAKVRAAAEACLEKMPPGRPR